MALHSISGNFTVVYENGIVPNIFNNAGSVRLGGAISSDNSGVGSDWNPMRLGDNAYANDFTLVVSGVGGAQEVNNQGTFGGGDQVIRLVTTDLAGVSNTTFQIIGSNAENRSNSIKALRSMRVLHNKKAIRNNSWDEFNAAWDAGTPENAQSGVWNQNTDTDVSSTANTADDAALASRAVPGEYVFLVGGNVVTSGDYPAKNT